MCPCRSTDLWSWVFHIRSTAITQPRRKFSTRAATSQRHLRFRRCSVKVWESGVLPQCKIIMAGRINPSQSWSVALVQASWWRISWGRWANSHRLWKESVCSWWKARKIWQNNSRSDSSTSFKRSWMFSWVTIWRLRSRDATDFSIKIKVSRLDGTLTFKVSTMTWCKGN